jgi:DNA polymerase-3 subunit gamma/tau
MAPEDVQLYYQIGIIGRRDLALAPDARTGLEMILLRMLAFRPASSSEAPSELAQKREAQPAQAPVTAAPAADRKTSEPERITTSDWDDIVQQLQLSGLTGEMAQNSVLEARAPGEITLVLDQNCAQLHSKEREAALKEALEKLLGAPLKLTMRIATPTGETPAQRRQREQDARQQAAAQAIYNDPNVKALEEQFNAQVNPESIRPKV